MRVVNSLKSTEQRNWSPWENNDLQMICNTYIDCKLCRKHYNLLKQYEAFAASVAMVSKNIEGILRGFINRVPDLKIFMMVNSVFDVNANRNGDWLVKFFIRELFPTDQQIEEVYEKDEVSQEILDKLKMFDPTPLGFEHYCDDIRIEYKLFNGYKDSINMIDPVWEDVNEETRYLPKVSKFIAAYNTISLAVNSTEEFDEE